MTFELVRHSTASISLLLGLVYKRIVASSYRRCAGFPEAHGWILSFLVEVKVRGADGSDTGPSEVRDNHGVSYDWWALQLETRAKFWLWQHGVILWKRHLAKWVNYMLSVFLSLELAKVFCASVFNRGSTIQPKLLQLLEDSLPTSTLISLCQRLSWEKLLLNLLNSKEVIEF